jgi:hypothetical protein
MAVLCTANLTAQQHPNQQKGFDPDRLYDFNQIDSVNTFNGNLIVTIPLGQRYQVDGGLSYGLTLVYNSHAWDAHQQTAQPVTNYAINNLRSNAGMGWLVSLGRLIPPSDYTNQTGPKAFSNDPASFIYESPDGNDHVFEGENAPDPAYRYVVKDHVRDPLDNIRMKILSNDSTRRWVEFPDGTVHEFHDFSTDTPRLTNKLEDWRLEKIRDPFGNSVHMRYGMGYPPDVAASGPSYEVWSVEEYPHGATTPRRTQTLYFALKSDATQNFYEPQKLLTKIVMTGFGGKDRTYDFTYTSSPVSLNRPQWDSSGPPHILNADCLWAPPPQSDDPPVVVPSDTNCVWEASHNDKPVQVYQLLFLDLPNEQDPPPNGNASAPRERYVMDYAGRPGLLASDEMGVLRRLYLPTGGQLEWDFGTFLLPGVSHVIKPYQQGETEPLKAPRSSGIGVLYRRIVDQSGAVTAEWRYVHRLSSFVNCVLPDPPPNTVDHLLMYDQLVSTTFRPDGTAEVHYYFVFPELDEGVCASYFPPGFNTSQLVQMYAKPFSPLVTDSGGRHLSTEIRTGVDPGTFGFTSRGAPRPPEGNGNGTVIQSTYTLFENLLETRNRTAHDADKTCGPDRNQVCETTVYNDNWDNFGHFRKTSTGGNFYSGGTIGGLSDPNFRTIFTNYSGPGPGADDWILNTYTEQCAHDDTDLTQALTPVSNCGDARMTSGTSLAPPLRQELCFNRSTGFLNLKRTFRDGGNLVVAYAPDDNGNVATESYYGGDGATAPSGCSTAAATATYSLTHHYQNGSLSQSQYSGAPFLSLDLDIDPNTGLASRSRDTAHLVTTFTYAKNGRLMSVEPPGVAKTTYTYTPFSSSPLHRTKVDIDQAVDGSGNTHLTYEYDHFGRVVHVENQMAEDSKISYHDITYDNMGRKSSVTTEALVGAQPAGATSYAYDIFSRPTSVTQPDGSVATANYTYLGVHQLLKSSKVATQPGGGQTDAFSVETYDSRGRLASVAEQAAPPGSSSQNGRTYDLNGSSLTFPVVADYGYDTGDRLVAVDMKAPEGTQHRRFTYDGAGFLLSEQHPEKGINGNGTVNYGQYDARGHVHEKIEGSAFHLKYGYDFAERLTAVDHLKDSLEPEPVKEFTYDNYGRLQDAVRHNNVATVGDVKVSEHFAYDEPGGRVSSRTTTVMIGTNQVQSFAQGFTYSNFGPMDSLTYPTCASVTPCAGIPERTIASIFHNGFLVGVRNYAEDGVRGIQYLPNGLITAVVHTSADARNLQTDLQSGDDSGIARPKNISFRGLCQGPPVNTSEPADKSVISGGSVTLRVTPPVSAISYKWYAGERGDISHPAPNGDGPALTIGPLIANTSYWVRVSDADCSTDSRKAAVTVIACDSFAITQQPVNDVITSSHPAATFTVQASPVVVTWQWYRGTSGDTSSPIPGATSSSYTTPALTQTTSYWARAVSIDGICSADSATATASVCAPPQVVRKPDNAVVAAGTVLQLSLTVSGAGPFTYTWGANGMVLRTATGTATTDNFSYTVAPGDDFTMTVVVQSQSCGSAQATFTIKAACPAPNIVLFTGGPIMLMRGQSFNLQVTTDPPESDTNHYSYQWYRNGVAFGANAPAAGIFETGFAIYNVSVKKTCSTSPLVEAQTSSARAYIYGYGSCPILPVTIDHTSTTLTPGQTLTLTASTDWPYGITYKWYRGASGDTRQLLEPVAGHPEQLTVASQAAQYWVRITNGCGMTQDSNTINISVAAGASTCDPITIIGQPQSQDIASGAPATLSVDANAPQAIVFYNWYMGTDTAHPVGSYSNRVLTVSPAETTTYWARVGNNCATADTALATVHVVSCATNHFTVQPAALSSPDNYTPVTLTAAVSDPAGVTYQWYEGALGDTTHPFGSTSGSMTTPLLNASTSYWARATTSAGCRFDSNLAIVNVCIRPTIDTLPQTNTSLSPGQGTSLAIRAHGTNLHYQWYSGASGDTSSPRNGDTLDAIWVSPATTSQYWVRVSNDCSTADSPTLQVSICPTITAGPLAAAAAVMPGTTTTLTVTATGSPLHYRWYVGAGSDITHPIANSDSATITTPAINQDTTFWVAVTSGGCETDSNSVTVPLCTSPATHWMTGSAYIHSGEVRTLTVDVAPNDGSTTLYWYSGTSGDVAGSTLLEGPTTSASRVVTPTATTSYWVRVKNATTGCYADTGNVTLTVCIPTITVQPVSPAMINSGQSATVSVAATGASTYQWYAGNRGDITNPVSGGTTAQLTVSPTTTTSYWVRVSGSCGFNVDSTAATVTICQPPAITTQPAGASVTRGNNATFAVAATGSALSYQWYEGLSGTTTSPIPGNSASLTIAPITPTNYWVRIQGGCGTVDSVAAHVSVCLTPGIDTQPQSTKVFSGGSATLTVAASESTGEPLHYQWLKGSTPVGPDSNTFNTGALTADTTYSVHVTAGVCAIDSQIATVSICPLAQSLPAAPDLQVTYGGGGRLQLGTYPTGTGFTWYKGALGDTSSPLTIPQAANYYDVSNVTVTSQYWAQVDSGGCSSRTAASTVSVCVPAITSTSALNVTINSGQTTPLSVVANTSPLTYQWYMGASGTVTTPISNANAASYNANPTSTQTYWVRVTNTTCNRSADGATFTVTVCQVPVITTQPSGASIVRGYSAVLSVVASGTALTYQWYQGSAGTTTIPLGTSSTQAVSPQNPTDYWVRVQNGCGTTNSSTAHVSVCLTPGIDTQPQSTKVFSGGSATLTVVASETTGEPLHYQWLKGSTPVGTDSNTFNTGALTADTTYSVHVTAGVCAIDSQTATVSICPLAQSLPAAPDLQVTYGGGGRLQLSTYPTGTAFTWYKGALGDTSSPLTIPQAANYYDVGNATATSQYWAQVDSGGCTSRTAASTVSVCVPTITSTSALNVTINSGQTTPLSVVANTSPLTYQWYKGTSGTVTTPISNTNASSYTANPPSTQTYWVRVMNTTCNRLADSATFTVTVCQVPAITTQPANYGPSPANNITLSAAASGSGLTYQWYRGLSGVTTNPVSGATGASMTKAMTASDYYWVRVSNTCGSVNSNAAFVSIYPVITQQPVSVSLSAGSTATFRVTATGNYLTYQWYQNDLAHPVGAPNATSYTTGPLNAAATFFATVSSGLAQSSSNAASVTMCDGPLNYGASKWFPNSCGTLSVSVDPSVAGATEIDWYQGTFGNTANLISTQSSVNVCPSGSTSYWVRLVDLNSGCYADLGPLTAP